MSREATDLHWNNIIKRVMAEVRVNGRDLGLLWKPPCRVDVSDVVKPGENHLEITVVNLWINRLIGDARHPDPDKRGRDGKMLAGIPAWLKNGTPRPETPRRTFASNDHCGPEDPLVASGLIGPVRLIRASFLALPSAR